MRFQKTIALTSLIGSMFVWGVGQSAMGDAFFYTSAFIAIMISLPAALKVARLMYKQMPSKVKWGITTIAVGIVINVLSFYIIEVLSKS